MNLIYLGLVTERVPIIPRFTPKHIGSDSPDLDFGEVFDIPRLQQAINLPILQWPQVKVSFQFYSGNVIFCRILNIADRTPTASSPMIWDAGTPRMPSGTPRAYTIPLLAA